MNGATYFCAHVVKLARDRCSLTRLVALALAIIGAIVATSGPLSAQDQTDSNNQAGLQSVLDAIAAGRAVSARVSLPLQIGFFAAQPALYITPEVGVDPKAPSSIITAAKQLAATFNANFIPQNFATLPGSPAVDDIFAFTNSSQGNVLASAPNPAGPTNVDVNYSPLWQVNLVSWNSGRQKRPLTSEAAIREAAADGDVSVTKTPIIVECSVIFTLRGGLLPGATVALSGSGTR
jgi:hypothetical protein